MKKRIIRSAVICVVLCAVMVAGVRPVLAEDTPYARTPAAEFGLLEGELHDAYIDTSIGQYEFIYETLITNRIYSTTTVRATVQVHRASTGAFLDDDQESSVGTTRAGYYFQLDHIGGYKTTKFKVYGAHEVIPPAVATGSTSHGVYTSNTYSYAADSQ